MFFKYNQNMVRQRTEVEKFSTYDVFEELTKLNYDLSHFESRDDICTPMDCVKLMLDYIPKDFWGNQHIKVLDPCCGNGNFGAYCRTKTSENNIYYNDTNINRLKNCIDLLSPKHINNESFFSLSGQFNTKYDLIMANPPYSGGGNKNRSISNQFILKSINMLNTNGYLCFITPNNWMSYNNNNIVLKRLLTEGSFIIIDNSVKRFFPSTGSSFTVFVWQKTIKTNKTTVINSYLKKDIQNDVVIPGTLDFLPLYISNDIINIINKFTQKETNCFTYRCDLHNFTQKALLSDVKTDIFKYETIHTPRKTRFAKMKQDIYDKYIIVVPLSTYYKPYICHNVNVTQSVGYIPFSTKKAAESFLKIMTAPIYKVLVHLTRYGNFNNIMMQAHKFYRQNILK